MDWSSLSNLEQVFYEPTEGGGGGGVPGNTVRDVRLDIAASRNRLSIGDEFPPFPYDGRGAGSVGTLTDVGGGIGRVLIPEENININSLPLVADAPELPIEVEITPTQDMTGTINFCTGDVSLTFDAIFQPSVFFVFRPTGVSVVTDLTTGTSTGSFAEVTGRAMDHKGDLRLVGVAVVPRTGDLEVDPLLGTPTDAVTEMEATLLFPDGRLECPTAPGGPHPNESFLVARDRAELFLGPQVYEAEGLWGEGEYELAADGWVNVRFNSLVAPSLMHALPGEDLQMDTQQLAGRVNLCTGEADLDLDATLAPRSDKNPLSPISVVTSLTTETASGPSTTTTAGQRIDRWGDGLLVGVALVSETVDTFTNELVGLPSEAVLRLPVNLRFVGETPICS